MKRAEIPTTNMLMALLLKLQDYMFNIKYQQGKKCSLVIPYHRLHIEAQDEAYNVKLLNI